MIWSSIKFDGIRTPCSDKPAPNKNQYFPCVLSPADFNHDSPPDPGSWSQLGSCRLLVACPQGKACRRAKDSKGRHRFAEVWEAQSLERGTNADMVCATCTSCCISFWQQWPWPGENSWGLWAKRLKRGCLADMAQSMAILGCYFLSVDSLSLPCWRWDALLWGESFLCN